MLFDYVIVIFNFGEWVGFVGVNGSGKFMLFFMLCGELYVDGGEVVILFIW